jgi:hypothetical protein
MTSPLPRVQVLRAPFSSVEEAVQIDPAVTNGSGSLHGLNGSRVSATGKTFFCCFWNRTSLFVVFSSGGSREIKNPAVILPQQTRRTPELWDLSEVVEVFVGPDARQTGRYFEFEVAPDGRWIALDVLKDSAGLHGNQEWETEFRCAVSCHPSQEVWKAALEIPWRDLGGYYPAGRWYGNFYRSIPGPGKGKLLAWSPTGTGPHCFHCPERFGELVLIPSP